jgi:hypothetical protein
MSEFKASLHREGEKLNNDLHYFITKVGSFFSVSLNYSRKLEK